MLLDGIYVPLTAPFYRDGALYLRKLEHNVGRYSLTPAAGLIALGPMGEAEALSDDETRDFFQAVGTTAAPEKVLVAGVRSGSVVHALATIEAAAGAVFDAVLLGEPTIERSLRKLRQHPEAELLNWFRTLADRSPLPLVLWSNASSQELSVDVVAELAGHPNILGLLDADLTPQRFAEISAATAGVQREVILTPIFAAVTARMLQARSSEATAGSATFVPAESLASGAAVAVAPPQPALRTRTKRIGFQVLGAGISEMLPLLAAGVRGLAPVLAACAPQACHEVYAAFKDGDPALAAEKEDRIRDASRMMWEEFGVAGMKHACDWNGYYGGPPRLPLLPLDAAEKAYVEAAMREIRN